MIEYPYTFILAHLPIKLKLITDKWLKELFDVANPDEIKALLGIDEPALEKYFFMHESGFGSYSSQMAYFLIEEKENGRKLGECGFHSWNPQHAKAEVFYKLFDDGDKQKGVMSAVLPKVIEYGFTAMNLNRIQAKIYIENIPSLKLLDKLGFSFEGIHKEDYRGQFGFEDSHCYVLFFSDWQKNPKLG